MANKAIKKLLQNRYTWSHLKVEYNNYKERWLCWLNFESWCCWLNFESQDFSVYFDVLCASIIKSVVTNEVTSITFCLTLVFWINMDACLNSFLYLKQNTNNSELMCRVKKKNPWSPWSQLFLAESYFTLNWLHDRNPKWKANLIHCQESKNYPLLPMLFLKDNKDRWKYVEGVDNLIRLCYSNWSN